MKELLAEARATFERFLCIIGFHDLKPVAPISGQKASTHRKCTRCEYAEIWLFRDGYMDVALAILALFIGVPILAALLFVLGMVLYRAILP